MSRPGSEENPLRIAVIGSGPAGFYTVHALFQKKDLAVRVDMFERLPTPFGLVRHGVAPDHAKIKSVTAAYEKLALHPSFRFFGNVEYGRDLTRQDLEERYHQIVFCTGAQTDRRLGIPGEDLTGSHPATEFVAWYNGHPDYHHLEFDLSQERAVVVGVGNVAVDVARILCRTREELASTDIADYALDALAQSRIREVYLVGRRGPAQAAFSNTEIKELGELADAATSTRTEEMELDPLSQAILESPAGKSSRRKVDILKTLAGRREPEKSKRLELRFLVSPVEILGDAQGHVSAVRLVRNELFQSEDGSLRPRPTEQHELLEAGLVFRSVGYRGVALPGLPFHERWGVLPNEAGRILDESVGSLRGLYCAGWIKRGPSGVIGTNKKDAAETVAGMLDDLRAGRHLQPEAPAPSAIDALLSERQVRSISYADWQKLDALEIERGKPVGRPRVKLIRREEFTRALSD